VSRAELQQFAEDRILDARALLAASRWQGAYYLSGYAVECGLKSCVLAHIERTGIIFKEKEYLEELRKCWTHNFEQILGLARLTDQRNNDIAKKAANWTVAMGWREGASCVAESSQRPRAGGELGSRWVPARGSAGAWGRGAGAQNPRADELGSSCEEWTVAQAGAASSTSGVGA
jgi:hypothetical protein